MRFQPHKAHLRLMKVLGEQVQEVFYFRYVHSTVNKERNDVLVFEPCSIAVALRSDGEAFVGIARYARIPSVDKEYRRRLAVNILRASDHMGSAMLHFPHTTSRKMAFDIAVGRALGKMKAIVPSKLEDAVHFPEKGKFTIDTSLSFKEQLAIAREYADKLFSAIQQGD